MIKPNLAKKTGSRIKFMKHITNTYSLVMYVQMELMYQQTEQIQEDCQFVWAKFCAREPTQGISPVDVDPMLTCKNYVVALSVYAHRLFVATCIFLYHASLKRKNSNNIVTFYKTLLNHIMVTDKKLSKHQRCHFLNLHLNIKIIKYKIEVQ